MSVCWFTVYFCLQRAFAWRINWFIDPGIEELDYPVPDRKSYFDARNEVIQKLLILYELFPGSGPNSKDIIQEATVEFVFYVEIVDGFVIEGPKLLVSWTITPS